MHYTRMCVWDTTGLKKYKKMAKWSWIILKVLIILSTYYISIIVFGYTVIWKTCSYELSNQLQTVFHFPFFHSYKGRILQTWKKAVSQFINWQKTNLYTKSLRNVIARSLLSTVIQTEWGGISWRNKNETKDRQYDSGRACITNLRFDDSSTEILEERYL